MAAPPDSDITVKVDLSQLSSIASRVVTAYTSGTDFAIERLVVDHLTVSADIAAPVREIDALPRLQLVVEGVGAGTTNDGAQATELADINVWRRPSCITQVAQLASGRHIELNIERHEALARLSLRVVGQTKGAPTGLYLSNSRSLSRLQELLAAVPAADVVVAVHNSLTSWVLSVLLAHHTKSQAVTAAVGSLSVQTIHVEAIGKSFKVAGDIRVAPRLGPQISVSFAAHLRVGLVASSFTLEVVDIQLYGRSLPGVANLFKLINRNLQQAITRQINPWLTGPVPGVPSQCQYTITDLVVGDEFVVVGAVIRRRMLPHRTS